MKHLVEQLSRYGDEEAIVLTASVADASFNHLGSTVTEGFLDSQKDIKNQFLVHCMKGSQENKDQNEKVSSDSRSKNSRRPSIISPVSLIKVVQEPGDGRNIQSTGVAKEGSTFSSPKGMKNGRKRPGPAMSSYTPPKRASISETVTQALQAISAETEHEINEGTGGSFKVESDHDDPDYIPNENADSSDTLSLDLGTGTKERHDRMKEFSDNEQTGPRFGVDACDPEKVKVEPEDGLEESKDQSDFDVNTGGAEDGEGATETVTKTGETRKKGRGRKKFDPYLVCKYCGKTYVRKNRGLQRLHRHEQAHIGLAPDLICKYCGKIYRCESGLQQHERLHEGKAPYNCTTCGKGIFGKWNYERHIASHVGIKNHECSRCGKHFLTEKELKRHQAHEDGNLTFKCKVCNKAFENSRNLNDHMNGHTGLRPYKCELCSKAYVWQRDLGRHMKKGHPENESVSVEKTD